MIPAREYVFAARYEKQRYTLRDDYLRDRVEIHQAIRGILGMTKIEDHYSSNGTRGKNVELVRGKTPSGKDFVFGSWGWEALEVRAASPDWNFIADLRSVYAGRRVTSPKYLVESVVSLDKTVGQMMAELFGEKSFKRNEQMALRL